METGRSPDEPQIVRWIEVPAGAARSRALAALDRIFFEASATKSFASADARSAFRERWMGRYLALEPELFYLALDAAGEVAGYLAGALDDPATSSRYTDIGYFPKIAHLTRLYPAHLHVNFAPSYRGRGWGKRLVARFASDATTTGAPGVHVVTGRGMRNVDFYAANGFSEIGGFEWNGRDLVVLGRPLGDR